MTWSLEAKKTTKGNNCFLIFCFIFVTLSYRFIKFGAGVANDEYLSVSHLSPDLNFNQDVLCDTDVPLGPNWETSPFYKFIQPYEIFGSVVQIFSSDEIPSCCNCVPSLVGRTYMQYLYLVRKKTIYLYKP